MQKNVGTSTMLKQDREKTKSVSDIARLVTSANITENTTQNKLNPKGCRLLGIGVIKAAIHDAQVHKDYSFFKSPMFHFWAGLAYGCKTDYRSDEDIINDILSGKLEKDLRKENKGRSSKWH